MTPLAAPNASLTSARPALSASTPALGELRQAAQAFEAIFLRQLLSSARAADFGGEEALLGGPGLEQFQAMQDEHFAEVASQQGLFGLADAIERQLSAQVSPVIETEA